MSNTLGRNFHHCFSLITPSKKRMAYPSKHHVNNHQYQSLKPPNTTYTKCYNSLFEDTACFPFTKTSTTSCCSPATYDALQSFTASLVPISSSSFSDTDIGMSEVVDQETPDLTEAYTSCRFFISSPGRSNSIIDSHSSSTSLFELLESPSTVGGVAVETYSSDPYVDFRRSMEEMVAAREVLCEDVNETWDYLEELLLSYLALNPKETQKYIVRAFGDMVVSNMSPPNNAATSSSSTSISTNCDARCTDNNNAPT